MKVWTSPEVSLSFAKLCTSELGLQGQQVCICHLPLSLQQNLLQTQYAEEKSIQQNLQQEDKHWYNGKDFFFPDIME